MKEHALIILEFVETASSLCIRTVLNADLAGLTRTVVSKNILNTRFLYVYTDVSEPSVLTYNAVI